MKANIGDMVWFPRFETHQEVWETCEECLGEKTMHVTLKNGEEYDIDCSACDPGGFQGPKGSTRHYKMCALGELREVVGMELSETDTLYRLRSAGGSWYNAAPDGIFPTQAEAVEVAQKNMDAHIASEEERLKQKAKPSHSWAWHVNYHRREIKRLECDLEQHRARLGIAQEKEK